MNYDGYGVRGALHRDEFLRDKFPNLFYRWFVKFLNSAEISWSKLSSLIMMVRVFFRGIALWGNELCFRQRQVDGGSF